MRIVRRIIVTDEFIDVAEQELALRDYSPHQAKCAENWILFGNWQYKKNYSLELSDFFPTGEQLQSTGQKHIPLQIAVERENALTQTITHLRREKERISEANGKKDQEKQLDDESERLLRQNMALTEQNLTLKMEIERLQKTIRENRYKTVQETGNNE